MHTFVAEMAWPSGYGEVQTIRLDGTDSCPGRSWALLHLSEPHKVKGFNETKNEGASLPSLESPEVLKVNDFTGAEGRPAANKASRHSRSSLKLFKNCNNTHCNP